MPRYTLEPEYESDVECDQNKKKCSTNTRHHTKRSYHDDKNKNGSIIRKSSEPRSKSGDRNKTCSFVRNPNTRSKSISADSRLKEKFDNNIVSKKYTCVQSTSRSQQSFQGKTILVPAIDLHDFQDYQKVLKNIDEYVEKEFSTKLMGTSIKIMLTDKNDFDRMIEFYEKNNYSYHTCRCTNENNLQIAIKGVPHSLSTDEITNILDRKYPVVRVERITSRINRRPTSTCFVEVVNNKLGQGILNLEYLLHTKVIVEVWNKGKVLPCKNCQRYSKEKMTTTLCTKCKGNHHFLICPLRKMNKAEENICTYCEIYHTDHNSCPYNEIINDCKKTIDSDTNSDKSEAAEEFNNKETKLHELFNVSNSSKVQTHLNPNLNQPPIITVSNERTSVNPNLVQPPNSIDNFYIIILIAIICFLYTQFIKNNHSQSVSE